jgi:hypothetical protein
MSTLKIIQNRDQTPVGSPLVEPAPMAWNWKLGMMERWNHGEKMILNIPFFQYSNPIAATDNITTCHWNLRVITDNNGRCLDIDDL